MNTGETDLQKLLADMEPILNDGEYVFATVSDMNKVPRELTIAEVREKEGHTVILSKSDADRLELSYEYIASWITLNIHSSLEAVGLTAAFATALGDNGISCNVVAGYYHDHIFVETKDEKRAMSTLLDMTKR